MKILMSLLVMMLLTKECDTKNTQTVSNSSAKEISTSVNQIQEDMVITYQATTRGFFEKVWVTKDSIFVSKDRNLEIVSTYANPTGAWDELTEILNKLDVKLLPNLEPPSKMFQYDGAAMATLKIETKAGLYKTNIFDHGYPPKEIEVLVNKVLSLKTMMLKQ